MPRDFKYRLLLTGKAEWDALMSEVQSVRSDCLRECVEAFATNLKRTATSAVMPSELAFMVRRDQIFYDNAVFKVTGKGNIKLSDFAGKDVSEEVEAEAQRQMVEYVTTPAGEKTFYKISLGVNYVEVFLQIPMGVPMQESIDALFASVVFGSWTAFETLASDLWVASVNNGPVKFRQEVEKSRHLKRRSETDPVATPDSGIDPARDYAGFLREERMVNFQTLPNIKKFYSILCDKPKMAELFVSSDPYIDGLAAVRNILAHKAGKVDKTFESQVEKFPEISTYKAGETLLLDGEFVKKLRLAAATVGNALIHHFDGMLAPPPTL